MQSLRYPMKYVAQRTGLSPHVLRVWERRYGAVRPGRSESNRRLYDEDEVIRLELLKKLIEAGHGIGQIATLPAAELESMAAALPSPAAPSDQPSQSSPKQDFSEQAWTHVVELRPERLRAVLDEAAVSLGTTALLEQLMVPLIERIGTGWETGELSAAEEHAATAVIREVILIVGRPFAESAGAPGLVVTTPAGQLHQLGAVLAATTARRLGWNVTYLGPSLPAEDIARAVIRGAAVAVALSIVYPGDDPQMGEELRRLRRLLPAGLPILIGGRSARFYKEVIAEIEATPLSDLAGFRAKLGELREGQVFSGPPSPPD